MPRFKDRTGDTYGRLTVISHNGKDKHGKHLWLCRCECGNDKIVSSDNLSSKKSKVVAALKLNSYTVVETSMVCILTGNRQC